MATWKEGTTTSVSVNGELARIIIELLGFFVPTRPPVNREIVVLDNYNGYGAVGHTFWVGDQFETSTCPSVRHREQTELNTNCPPPTSLFTPFLHHFPSFPSFSPNGRLTVSRNLKGPPKRRLRPGIQPDKREGLFKLRRGASWLSRFDRGLSFMRSWV